MARRPSPSHHTLTVQNIPTLFLLVARLGISAMARPRPALRQRLQQVSISPSGMVGMVSSRSIRQTLRQGVRRPGRTVAPFPSSLPCSRKSWSNGPSLALTRGRRITLLSRLLASPALPPVARAWRRSVHATVRSSFNASSQCYAHEGRWIWESDGAVQPGAPDSAYGGSVAKELMRMRLWSAASTTPESTAPPFSST